MLINVFHDKIGGDSKRFVFMVAEAKEPTPVVAPGTEKQKDLPWKDVEAKMTPEEKRHLVELRDDFKKASDIAKTNLALLKAREDELLQRLEPYKDGDALAGLIVAEGVAVAGSAWAPHFNLSALSLANFTLAASNIQTILKSDNIDEIRKSIYQMDDMSNLFYKKIYRYQREMTKKYSNNS